MLNVEVRRQLERATEGWIKSGCGNPLEVEVRNTSDHPLIVHWHVFVKFAGFRCRDDYWVDGFYDDRRAADRCAAAVSQFLDRMDRKYSVAA